MRVRVFVLTVLLFTICGLLPAKARRARVMRMEATAFSQYKRPTASLTAPHEGIVAADPSVLPLGTVIQISGAGTYDGLYLVTDTGRKIDGRHIDIFIPSAAEAKQFGKKIVTVKVLDRGEGKQDAREKDATGAVAEKAVTR